jgi:WD40 repeat protein
VRTFSGHTAALTGLRFTPDGAWLVSTSRDGTLRVWNPDAARAKSVVTVGPENQHCCFALDRSGRYAFVASHGGFVSVLKLP